MYWELGGVDLIPITLLGGVFDLAVEQPQLFRKLPKNKTNKNVLQCLHITLFDGGDTDYS